MNDIGGFACGTTGFAYLHPRLCCLYRRHTSANPRIIATMICISDWVTNKPNLSKDMSMIGPNAYVKIVRRAIALKAVSADFQWFLITCMMGVISGRLNSLNQSILSTHSQDWGSWILNSDSSLGRNARIPSSF